MQAAKPEDIIYQYKMFYRKHLINIKNKKHVIEELRNISKRFNNMESGSPIFLNKDRLSFEKDVELFIQNNFNKEILDRYNSEPHSPSLQDEFTVGDRNFWENLLLGLAIGIKETEFKYQVKHNHKKKLINYLYNCMRDYGLHPYIWQRNPMTEKKYNLLIHNDFKSSDPQLDHKVMMSYQEFKRDFLDIYKNKKPIKIQGKLIPFESIIKVKVTTTLLKEDEINLFALRKGFKWDEKEKDKLSFLENCDDETDEYQPNPFANEIEVTSVNKNLIEETKQFLSGYPKAHTLYARAVRKYDHEDLERNLLDDLRLTLETLINMVLGTQKSLENQLNNIAEYLKTRNAPKSIINMLYKLIDYYTKYQNDHVKHDEKVEKREIDFVLELTSTFIRYIVKYNRS